MKYGRSKIIEITWIRQSVWCLAASWFNDKAKKNNWSYFRLWFSAQMQQNGVASSDYHLFRLQQMYFNGKSVTSLDARTNYCSSLLQKHTTWLRCWLIHLKLESFEYVIHYTTCKSKFIAHDTRQCPGSMLLWWSCKYLCFTSI